MTRACFYVPAEELSEGTTTITLGLEPARNGQVRGTRMASAYRAIPLL